MIDPVRMKRNMNKRIRSEVRLKHSIEADNELAEVLPRLEAQFVAGLQRGVVLELQPGTLEFYVEPDK